MTTLGKSAPSSFSGRVTDAIRALAAEAAHNSRRHAALDVLANYVSLLPADDPRLVALSLLQAGDGFSLTPEPTRLLSWIGGTGKGNVPEPGVTVSELVVAAILDAQRVGAEARREDAVAQEGALISKYKALVEQEKEKTAAVQDKLAVTRAELDQAKYQAGIFKRIVEADDKPQPKAKVKT